MHFTVFWERLSNYGDPIKKCANSKKCSCLFTRFKPHKLKTGWQNQVR